MAAPEETSLSSISSSTLSLADASMVIRDDDGLIPMEEGAMRKWFIEQGFKADDIDSFKIIDGWKKMHPMMLACEMGELHVCKWIYNNGGSEKIFETNEDGITPMFLACMSGHLEVCQWLFDNGAMEDVTKASNDYGFTPMYAACLRGQLSICKWLFEVGASADITRMDSRGATPIFAACEEGHLSICKWLYERGATSDITKARNDGATPMSFACQEGHLSICKWLFVVGASSDVTMEDNFSRTPMFFACQGGQLPICQWLFEVGAAADITKMDNESTTPMRAAFLEGNLKVCQWLILRGALNRRSHQLESDGGGSGDGGSGVGGGSNDDDDDDDHVSPLVANVDTAPVLCDTDSLLITDCESRRLTLLVWAKNAISVNDIFLNILLRASVVLPNRGPNGNKTCLLPRLPRCVFEQLGLLLGLEYGRRLRNVREFAEALDQGLVRSNATSAH